MKHLLTAIFLICSLQAKEAKTITIFVKSEQMKISYQQHYDIVISHIKNYEKLHTDHKNLEGYGVKTKNPRNLSEIQADSQLRVVFNKKLQFVKKHAVDYNSVQCLYLAAFAYNCGTGSLMKVLSGKRTMISFCHYRGKVHRKLSERRVFEIINVLKCSSL